MLKIEIKRLTITLYDMLFFCRVKPVEWVYQFNTLYTTKK